MEQKKRKGELQEDRTESDWNSLGIIKPWNMTPNIQSLWCAIWALMDLVSPATQAVPLNARSLAGIHTPSIYNILGFLLHSITQWLLRASSRRIHLHLCYMFSDTSDLLKPWYKPPQPHHSGILDALNSSTFFQKTSSKDLEIHGQIYCSNNPTIQ